MSDPACALADPLLHSEAAASSAVCGGRALGLVSLVVGLGLVVHQSPVLYTSSWNSQQSTLDGPDATTSSWLDEVIGGMLNHERDSSNSLYSSHKDLDNTTLEMLSHFALAPGGSLRSISALGARRQPNHGSASRPLFDERALGQAPWVGFVPEPRVEVKRPRHVETSAYGVFHPDLAALAISPDEMKAALSMLQELPREFFEWYDAQALEFPLRTKACTSGFCYSLGDMGAQAFAGQNLTTINFARSARSGAAGFVGHGPVAHYWIQFLETYLSFGGAWWAVFPKIIANQPMNIVYNTIYSCVTGALSFRKPKDVLRDVRAAAWPGFIASIKFWPFVNLVTFGLIPIELRVAWVDTVKIVWICILSRINNEGLNKRKAEGLIDEKGREKTGESTTATP
eukprot:gnl/TRDRNA2_/TRDRNA2_87740_c0_seq1.p1 gnl/TRDRNA2_/TRDRNA2_87740_c0~~gnl/TRDRNA2_/TRDRNA2_87740_c0_seq1.p1  ORF type:complete len:399 (-),score=56.16 gnl/TRDRNA2_/TRDRNA2_87740_c0_seq1:199-1395(-)